jgi:sorbitol-specific phosphotransferase system component IIC
MKCPSCSAENPATALTCSSCGRGLGNVYAAPISLDEPPTQVASGGGVDEAVATIIPYKNPAALIAYYLGLFSCFPVLGFPMAIIALVLAFKGFKARRLNPQAHGTAHAWVGLVCGTIGLLINGLIVTALVIALVGASMKR